MKKIFLMILFTGAIACVHGQQFVECNFDCIFYNISDCSPFVSATMTCARGSTIASDWKASHGSPSLVFSSSVNQCILKGKESNGDFTGEGIFTSYPFKKGRKYVVEVSVRRNDSNQGGQLHIKAAKSVPAGGASTCGEAKLPAVSQSEDVYILNRSNTLDNVTKIFTSPEFIPTQDLDQLWVYAEEIFLGNSFEFQMKYVTVSDVGPSSGQPSNPPPADGQCNPPVGPTEFHGAVAYNKVLLTWVDNADNEVYYLLDKASSRKALPSNTTSFIDSNVLPGTEYQYSVASSTTYTHYDPRLGSTVYLYCPSAFANLTIQTPPECPNSIVIEDEDRIEFTHKAANYIDVKNSTVLSNPVENVVLAAGNGITLSPGTKILKGATFIAKIEPCVETMQSAQAVENSRAIDLQPAEQQTYADIYAYPNPTLGPVDIYFKTPLESDGAVKVLDRFSNIVYSATLTAGDESVSLDIQNLPSDIYYVHIITTSGSKMTRLIRK